MMTTWSGRRQNLGLLLTRCVSKQQKTLQELLSCYNCHTRLHMAQMQNLINIAGENMDVQVSIAVASAGIYAPRYAMKNS